MQSPTCRVHVRDKGAPSAVAGHERLCCRNSHCASPVVIAMVFKGPSKAASTSYRRVGVGRICERRRIETRSSADM